ncbi:intermembrane lipid transfer protein VPS13C-like [Lampetra fluviatilis]
MPDTLDHVSTSTTSTTSSTTITTTTTPTTTTTTIPSEASPRAYVVHMKPVARLRNLLPYRISYMMEGTCVSVCVEPGRAADLLQWSDGATNQSSLTLHRYQGKDWTSMAELACGDALPRDSPLSFSPSDDGSAWGRGGGARGGGRGPHPLARPPLYLPARLRTQRLRPAVDRQSHRTDTSIHPAGRGRGGGEGRGEGGGGAGGGGEGVKHNGGSEEPLLMAVSGREKVRLCVGNSLPSADFSMETAGSSGCLRCKPHKQASTELLVGVSIRLSSFALTKVVTLSAFHVAHNSSSVDVELQEVGSHRWTFLSPGERAPLWPECAGGRMRLRVAGSELESVDFLYTLPQPHTALQLQAEPFALCVEVSVGESSALVRVSDYTAGAAPVLIINHTESVALTYSQSGGVERWLMAGQAVLMSC